VGYWLDAQLYLTNKNHLVPVEKSLAAYTFHPHMNMTMILLLIVPMVIGLWAQSRVKSAFGKWSKIAATSGVTGAQAARKILSAANITDVEVVEINDMLGDHYDPMHKRLCLSSPVYRTPSVASLGIAAHECGHGDWSPTESRAAS